ncbi:MAG: transglutaminase domain-containing protein [Acidobacteriota bacterium]
MPRAWFWFAASLAILIVAPLEAATELERRVTVDIRPDGTVREYTRLKVRMDSVSDPQAWGDFPIYLDDHRTLEHLEAYALRPDGERVKVRRKDQDTLEYSGESVLHGSAFYRLVQFPGVQVGWVLVLDYAVRIEPYYPADRIFLRSTESIEQLEIIVRGGGASWRWRIDGSTDGFEITESAGGVTVRGRDVAPYAAPALAPDHTALGPILRYAWSDDPSWEGVGRWYSELLRTVPRGAAPVRTLARELIAGQDTPRQRLEALLTFLRKKVRYVAVEIGIGGFRPSSPEDVLSRKWGDCKDKSLLLIDLLAEAGIEAYPVLINSGRTLRTDPEFPSHIFNHLIVAVPADAVEHSGDEPVAEGYLFVDPTQTRGSASWLQPADQDQHVLVVRDGSGVFLRTATQPQAERRAVDVAVTVTPAGDATGRAIVRLSGRYATPWLSQDENAPQARTAEDALAVFAQLLPGARFESVGWSTEEDGVPNVELAADLTYPALVRGQADRRSFQVPGLRSTVEPSLLAERKVPIVLPPCRTDVRWTVTLPEGWCPPKEQQQRVENTIGVFEQSVRRSAAGQVVLQRSAEVHRRWIAPDLFPQLQELALAESRAERRRVRLRCEDAQAAAQATSSR